MSHREIGAKAGGECLTFDQLALRSPLGKAAVRCVARELTVR